MPIIEWQIPGSELLAVSLLAVVMLRDSKAHALARPGLTELRETSDSVVLAELGVQQVFKRELNTFTNCAVAFSIISVPATIPSA